jgi:hypothetical protein
VAASTITPLRITTPLSAVERPARIPASHFQRGKDRSIKPESPESRVRSHGLVFLQILKCRPEVVTNSGSKDLRQAIIQFLLG